MHKHKFTSKYYSISQAARFLNVSKDTLRRWEKKGHLKPLRSPSNHRFYTQKQLKAMLKNHPYPLKYPSFISVNQIKAIIIITALTIFIISYLLYLISTA